MNDKDLEKLVFGMAHQIRNPAAIIKANAGVVLEKERLSAEGRRSVESIINGVKYLEERLDEFVEFSKPLSLKLERVDLSRLFADSFAVLKDQCQLKRARISSKLGEFVLARADKNQIFLALPYVCMASQMTSFVTYIRART